MLNPNPAETKASFTLDAMFGNSKWPPRGVRFFLFDKMSAKYLNILEVNIFYGCYIHI